MTKKQTAESESTDITTFDPNLFGSKESMPAQYVENMESGQGLGNEEVDGESMSIPQLKLMQPTSPELTEIDGAKAGQFLLTLTEELFDFLVVAPLKFQKEYTVFKDRNLGGGRFGTFDSEGAAVAHVSTLPGDATHYQIAETYKNIVMVLDPLTGECITPAIYYMTNTAREPARKWNSLIAKVNGKGDRFISVWKFEPLKRKNDKGTWFVPDISHVGWTPQSAYAECRAFYGDAANDASFDGAATNAA